VCPVLPQVRDELEQLLDDDIDMSEMYLTRKLTFQGFHDSLGSPCTDEEYVIQSLNYFKDMPFHQNCTGGKDIFLPCSGHTCFSF
jgi:hypothetical protein